MNKWVARLTLAVLGVFLAAAGLEGGLAAISLMRPSVRKDTFYQPDPCVGWRHIPHKREGSTTVGRVVLDQPINSAGFRDREYPQRKAQDSFRIIVLGDSFADQLEMRTQHLYHEMLERKLNATGFRPVEVVNLGVAGFGTGQEYLTLKCYGLKYEPDLVILALFVGNDLFDNSITLYEQYVTSNPSRPFFELVEGKLQRIEQTRRSRPIKRAVSRLLPRSFGMLSRGKRRLPQLLVSLRDRTVRSRAFGAVSPSIDGSYVLYQDPYPPGWDGAWAVTKALILEIATELSRSKASFFVVVIPNEWEFRPDRWQQVLNENPQMRALRFDLGKPERILSEFFQENRINYLLLRQAFDRRTKQTGEDLHFHHPIDNHWNTQGHALAASEIFERLIGDGLLRRIAAP